MLSHSLSRDVPVSTGDSSVLCPTPFSHQSDVALPACLPLPCWWQGQSRPTVLLAHRLWAHIPADRLLLVQHWSHAASSEQPSCPSKLREARSPCGCGHSVSFSMLSRGARHQLALPHAFVRVWCPSPPAGYKL